MNQNQEQNEKKHNYFYKITNLINGKFYYGIYSTNKDKYDYYMGSGVAIQKAIIKYGKENFIKEIIEDYPTRKEASDHEKKIVTEELIHNPLCYNMKVGGFNGTRQNKEVRQRIGEKSKGRYWTEELKEWKRQQQLGKKASIETCQLISRLRSGVGNGMFGRTFYECWVEKYGKEVADAKLEQHKEKHRNQIPHNAKKCIIENLVFQSISAVGKYYDISEHIVKSRIKSEDMIWKNWNFK